MRHLVFFLLAALGSARGEVFVYLVERVVVETPTGITSLVPGAKAALLSREGATAKVRTRDGTFTVHASQITADPAVATLAARRDAQAQSASRHPTAAPETPASAPPPAITEMERLNLREEMLEVQSSRLSLQLAEARSGMSASRSQSAKMSPNAHAAKKRYDAIKAQMDALERQKDALNVQRRELRMREKLKAR